MCRPLSVPSRAVFDIWHVVDCGDAHSSVHKFGQTQQREAIELSKGKLTHRSQQVRLAAVLCSRQFDNFLSTLRDYVEEQDEDQPRVYVGATSGVRQALEAGEINQTTLDDFGEQLRRHVGGSAQFALLSERDEVMYEFEAARYCYSELFAEQGHKEMGFISGGLMSCHFVWTEKGVTQVRSMLLSSLDMEKHVREQGDQAVAIYQDVCDKAVAESDLPLLDGGFLLNALNHEMASLCGLARQFVKVKEVVRKLEKLIFNLQVKSGWGWDLAKDRWGKRCDELCVVGLMNSIRLLSLLQKCRPEADLYFATSSPNFNLDITWRSGAYTALSARDRKSVV